MQLNNTFYLHLYVYLHLFPTTAWLIWSCTRCFFRLQVIIKNTDWEQNVDKGYSILMIRLTAFLVSYFLTCAAIFFTVLFLFGLLSCGAEGLSAAKASSPRPLLAITHLLRWIFLKRPCSYSESGWPSGSCVGGENGGGPLRKACEVIEPANLASWFNCSWLTKFTPLSSSESLKTSL